jgi:hypothetical protein
MASTIRAGKAIDYGRNSFGAGLLTPPKRPTEGLLFSASNGNAIGTLETNAYAEKTGNTQRNGERKTREESVFPGILAGNAANVSVAVSSVPEIRVSDR